LPSGFEISTKRRYRKTQDMNSFQINDKSLYTGDIALLFLSTTIEKSNISSRANALSCASISSPQNWGGGASNGFNNRSIFMGGTGDGGTYLSTVIYLNFTNDSDAKSFGTVSARGNSQGCSNGINNTAIYGYGQNNGGLINTIDYIRINVPSNSASFGSGLTTARCGVASFSNSTNNRGIFSGGFNNTPYNNIEFINIAVSTNSMDFGDLTVSRGYQHGSSNAIGNRGVTCGGATTWQTSGTVYNTIDYITISVTGNATDFGDLSAVRYLDGCTSNGLNNSFVTFGGYYNPGGVQTAANVRDYGIFTTLANSVNFGNLGVLLSGIATSNA
jgi:hypothetical protein